MTMPVVLVLGFEPFADETINPSAEIARSLDGEVVGSFCIISAILPVNFAEAPLRLAELLVQHRPQLVIALGQAGGRSEISLERVAINLIDARIADNGGLQPIDVEVLQGGPGAYFSGLQIKAIHEELKSLDVPTALSLSAGTYVCNQVAYWLGHLLATEHPETRGGFIHVPWLPEQATRHGDEPSMPLEMMINGIRAAIECSLRTTTDLRVSGGAIH